MLNSAAISVVANERAGSPANRIKARSAKSVNEVRRMEPLENLTLRTIYSRLNRYLKCLFKETAVTGQDRTGQEGSGQEASGQERRERISAEIAARTGITEAVIEHLVHAFYAKVRSDPMLAPCVRGAYRRLGAASGADVRVLVVGRAG